jgi:hypothetical protein
LIIKIKKKLKREMDLEERENEFNMLFTSIIGKERCI